MSWHVSPAVSWAGVGGHGYDAASVAVLPPVLSGGQVPTRSPGSPHGGPEVGERIVNDAVLPGAGMVPVELVEMARDKARLLHDTGSVSGVPSTLMVTVGWLASLLHWRMMPRELSSKPDPVTVTTLPPFRQVPGVTVICGGPVTLVGAALQGTVVVVVGGAVVVVVVVVDVVVVDVVVVVAFAPACDAKSNPPPPDSISTAAIPATTRLRVPFNMIPRSSSPCRDRLRNRTATPTPRP
jgi:hypothetical protein